MSHERLIEAGWLCARMFEHYELPLDRAQGWAVTLDDGKDRTSTKREQPVRINGVGELEFETTSVVTDHLVLRPYLDEAAMRRGARRLDIANRFWKDPIARQAVVVLVRDTAGESVWDVQARRSAAFEASLRLMAAQPCGRGNIGHLLYGGAYK